MRPLLHLTRRMLAALTMAAAAAMIAGTTPTAGAAALGSCKTMSLPVALAPGQPADQSLRTTLCMPDNWGTGPQTVVTFVHGATYNATYWDWPVGTQYSAVADTLARGWASVTFDEVGAGQSSHPPSTAVTTDVEAYALHQVLAWERSLHRFQAEVVIGHSWGSVTAVDEAASWGNDEAALVLTGYSHALDNLTAGANPPAFSDFAPANTDPRCGCPALDSGYLTSVPGSRPTLFYDAATADPAVMDYDEAHPDAVSATQVGTGVAQVETPAAINISQAVTVPVLEVIGQEDALWCGPGSQVNCADANSVRTFEAPYFRSAALFDVQTIQGAGHSLALHPSAQMTEAQIDDWLAANAL